MLDYAQARRLMVDCQLRTFDVNDIAVLDAFDAVPREDFVPPGAEPFAYIDQNLKLGGSEGDVRYMPASMLLARMIQALRIGNGTRVLDVGTGYGYAAVLMARLGGRVTALEADSALAEAARARLAGTKVEVAEGPLAEGQPKGGPFDAILINGRVEVRPQALLDQLKDEGRLVCVLGRDKSAKATLFVRAGDAFGARPLFDAGMPGLAAFREAAGFAF